MGLGLTVVVAELVGLGDAVGDIVGTVVGVAGAEGARLGRRSEPIGLSGPPELWGSENSRSDRRVVEDRPPPEDRPPAGERPARG